MARWNKISRKIIYKTKFINFFEDTVQLPSGQVFDDYSVINFTDSVIIVATDENDRILLFSEYKYAIDEEILTFPAGGIEGDQTPAEAALRELLEETGYTSTEVEVVGESRDYPLKIQHTDYIVRIKNAKKVQQAEHEATESIGEARLIPLNEINDLWQKGKFNCAYMTAALAHTFPELLIKNN